MASPGRPRSLDQTKRREVCAVIASGCSLEDAARYVGCSTSTIRREALRNEEFRKRLRAAELQCQIGPLKAINKAANTHWRAAAWYLSRTNPKRFDGGRRGSESAARELHDVIDAIVQEAVDEIDDPTTRDRVCRRLLAAAYRATRSLTAEERRRLDPRAGTFDKPLSRDEREMQQFVAELEKGQRQAWGRLTDRLQNPRDSA